MYNFKPANSIFLFISILILSTATSFSQTILISELESKLAPNQLEKLNECKDLLSKSELELARTLEIESKFSTENNTKNEFKSAEANRRIIAAQEYSLEASIIANEIYFDFLASAYFSTTEEKESTLKNIQQVQTELQNAKNQLSNFKEMIKSDIRKRATWTIIDYTKTIQRLQNFALENQTSTVDLYLAQTEELSANNKGYVTN